MAENAPKGIKEHINTFTASIAGIATALAAVLGLVHQMGWFESAPPKNSSPSAAVAVSAPPAAPQVRTVSSEADAAKAPGPVAARDNVARAEQRPANAAAVDAAKPLVANSAQGNAQPLKPNQARHPNAVHTQIAMANAASGASAMNPPNAPNRVAIANANVQGAWRDYAGGCHLIKQAGPNLELINFAPVSNAFVTAGHGQVAGRNVHLHFNNLNKFAPEADLILSDDGKKLVGTIVRKDTGEHPIAWHREGDGCS